MDVLRLRSVPNSFRRSLAQCFSFLSSIHGLSVKPFVIVAAVFLAGVFVFSILVPKLQYLELVALDALLIPGLLAGLLLVVGLLLAETQRREQETVTLYRLMMKIASSLDFDHVVQAIAEGARQVLHADIGAVALVDAARAGVLIKACAGNRTEIWKGLCIPLRNSLSPNPPVPLSPLCIEEFKADLGPQVAELMAEEGIVSLLAVPMWRSGQLYGFVSILTRRRRHLRKQDIQLLARFVLQVVVAIENADLYKQVRYMATLEERDRLARELHDNLAQMLGYLNTQASVAKHLLANREIEGAFASVLELEKVTDQVYADVRETIFSLRTIASSGWKLIPTLREYLADYQKHYGIDAQLVVGDESCGGLDAEVQVQAIRIIQEALTNVRKHSEANRVRVKFESEDHSVQISVEDDGRGFDPDHLSGESSEHFGLQIMRERAASVGGRLNIDSGSKIGTRVVLRVPLFSLKEKAA